MHSKYINDKLQDLAERYVSRNGGTKCYDIYIEGGDNSNLINQLELDLSNFDPSSRSLIEKRILPTLNGV